MRVIWLLGADSSIKRDLEKYLDVLRVGVPYRVRLASALSDVPEEDISMSSTVFLVDAFHPMYPGFEGLRAVRKRGAKGPVFLFGEPATENAIGPFQQDHLTGYFPAFETVDLALVAGVIHYQLHFDGLLDIKLFLREGGRASVEQIRSFKDYNAFGVKLATFVGRFGVEIGQLKKVLMGLSLGHIKTGAGGPEVEQPFSIFYGMDPQKLVVAAPTFSRGASQTSFLSHFCDVLTGLRNNKSIPGSIFPELFHVGRAAENLIVFSGNYQAAQETMDPIVLMTTLPFPKVKEKAQAPYSVFAFCNSQPMQNDEMIPGAERQAPDRDLLDANAGFKEPPPQATILVANTERVAQEIAPNGTINNIDLNEILNEPSIIGDVPVTASTDGGPGAGGDSMRAQRLARGSSPKASAPLSVSDIVDSAERGDEQPTFDSPPPQFDSIETDRIRSLNQALAADVKRLMKERRQPTTDRELRDAVEQLQEKLKRSLLRATALETTIQEKEGEINMIKAQMESLKKSKAA